MYRRYRRIHAQRPLPSIFGDGKPIFSTHFTQQANEPSLASLLLCGDEETAVSTQLVKYNITPFQRNTLKDMKHSSLRVRVQERRVQRSGTTICALRHRREFVWMRLINHFAIHAIRSYASVNKPRDVANGSGGAASDGAHAGHGALCESAAFLVEPIRRIASDSIPCVKGGVEQCVQACVASWRGIEAGRFKIKYLEQVTEMSMRTLKRTIRVELEAGLICWVPYQSPRLLYACLRPQGRCVAAQSNCDWV